MFTGIGLLLGSLFAAFATQFFTPYHVFFLSSLLSCLVTYSGLMANDELETNEYATMRDPLELEELDNS